MMKQQHSLHIPRTSLKQVLLAVVGSGLGVFGLLVTVALSIVVVLTHPKRRTTRDLYTLSPYEFDLPTEAVRFPTRQERFPGRWLVHFVSTGHDDYSRVSGVSFAGHRCVRYLRSPLEGRSQRAGV